MVCTKNRKGGTDADRSRSDHKRGQGYLSVWNCPDRLCSLICPDLFGDSSSDG